MSSNGITNVEYEVKDGKLVLTIDLDKEYGVSKSGKTVQVATTHGFSWHTAGQGIGFSVNVNKFPNT